MVAILAIVLVAAVAMRSLVVMPRSIPSESMLPGLLPGDMLLVAKWPYGWSRFSLPFGSAWPARPIGQRLPVRGDIVIFRSPADDREDYVKRVVGLPGDIVAMRRGRLTINGAALLSYRIADFTAPLDAGLACRSARGMDGIDGDLCRWPRWREALPDGRQWAVTDQGATAADTMAPVRVPAGRMLVLGDNRDVSADSRFAVADGGVGLVPLDRLEGRAMMVIASSAGGSWRDPLGWLRGMRPARIGVTP